MKKFRLALALVVPLILATVLVLAVSGALPYKLYVVHTGSMSPTIPSRSAVIVQENHFSIGEPITFVANGEVITHRLVAISAEGTTTTEGDANATPDTWHVPTSAIIGGVVTTVPELGYWITYLKNPVGLVSILAGVLLLWQIWSFAGGAPRDQRVRSTTAGESEARVRHRRRDRARDAAQTGRRTVAALPSSSA